MPYLKQILVLFLFAQLVMGTGITLLQTAVNLYVVRIEPEESATARISIMGILNKSAGVIAPLIFAALITSGFKNVGPELTEIQIENMANGLILPYLGMALFIGVLAVIVKMSPLPELDNKKENQQANNKGHIREALAHPNLALGVLAIFFYVTVEVIAGDTIGSFALSLGVEIMQL